MVARYLHVNLDHSHTSTCYIASPLRLVWCRSLLAICMQALVATICTGLPWPFWFRYVMGIISCMGSMFMQCWNHSSSIWVFFCLDQDQPVPKGSMIIQLTVKNAAAITWLCSAMILGKEKSKYSWAYGWISNISILSVYSHLNWMQKKFSNSLSWINSFHRFWSKQSHYVK